MQHPASHAPPRLAAWLLDRYFARHRHPELVGDLHELFDLRRRTRGRVRSVMWYWAQVVSFPFHRLRERLRQRRESGLAPALRSPRHDGSSRHRGPMLGSLLQDVRYAARRLRQSPGFTAVAVTIMGLGIGANTAIFSIVNAVLFKPLPYDKPAELVRVFTTQKDGVTPAAVSYPDFLDFREREDLFAGAMAHTAAVVSVINADGSKVVFAEYVSANFFTVLGLSPSLGRAFAPIEDEPGAAETVAMISHQAWERRFGGDPNAIGATIRLNGRPVTIVGVGPKGFNGTMVGLRAEFWVPWGTAVQIEPGQQATLDARTPRALSLTARLQPGVTVQQARVAMQAFGKQLAETYPESNEGRNVVTMSGNDVRLHPFIDAALYPVAGLLMAIVGLVLLVACTNLANLLLVRASTRRKEIAIRLSMGASRGRLISQLLTESTLLGLLGGAVGLAIAYWTAKLITSFRPPIAFPIAIDLSLDGTVLAFTLVLSVLTGVIFGLVPSIKASRPDLVSALKHATSSLGSMRRRFGLKNVLVVAQVAVSLVLLVAAGLFVRGLARAQLVDPGFETRNAAIATINLALAGYGTDEAREFYRELTRRLESYPGVRAIALVDRLPLAASVQTMGVKVDGHEPPPNEDEFAFDFSYVSSEYFKALGVPILRGRSFTENDVAGQPKLAIVNAAMAQQFWGTDAAVGQQFRTGSPERTVVVVGVAANTKVRTLGEAPRRQFYLPLAQRAPSSVSNVVEFVSVVMSTEGDPAPMLEVLRREVVAMDSDVPLFAVKTMEEHLGIILFAPRMAAFLLSGFGLLAMLLACIGLYGVIASSVAQQTREMGIRVALGADRFRVVGMVVRDGMAMVGLGVVIGLSLSVLATRPIAGLLHGVSSTDTATFAGVAVLFAAVALVASYVPARRAANVDPMVALRYE